MKNLGILSLVSFVAAFMAFSPVANAKSITCRTSGDCPKQCMKDIRAAGCENCHLNCTGE